MVLNVALAGVKPCGVSAAHMDAIASLQAEGLVELVALAEMNLSNLHPERWKGPARALLEGDARLYDDFSNMMQHERVDAVTIATPHHLHVPMAAEALENGSHVFLEKPPALTMGSGRELLSSGKTVGVNYMYAAAESALELAARIADLGELTHIVGIGKWMRWKEYFSRASWAGKAFVDDVPVLDGCLFNQFGHLLNQILMFSGASPQAVRAELYRGHTSTEMEDTACLSIRTDGPELLLYCTVCHTQEEPYEVYIYGSKASAHWTPGRYEIRDLEGRTIEKKTFKETWASLIQRNYRDFIAAVQEQREPIVALERGLLPTLIVNAAYVSAGYSIRQVPEHAMVEPYQAEKPGTTAGIQTDKVTVVPIRAVGQLIDDASKMRRMFSEMSGLSWGRQTGYVSISGLEFDPGRLR